LFSGSFCLMMSGAHGHAEVVGLTGQVRRDVVVRAALLEGLVAHVAPEHRGHAELVRIWNIFGDFHDLARGVVGAEVHGGADAVQPMSQACLIVPQVICSALFG
jgi:hypothetical protein